MWLVVSGVISSAPTDDALAVLDDARDAQSKAETDVPEMGRLEQVGAWIYRTFHLLCQRRSARPCDARSSWGTSTPKS